MLDGTNATLNGMLMGVLVTAPEPEYPDDHIPPFDAHNAMFSQVIAPPPRVPEAIPSSEATSWLPRETEYDGAIKAWSSVPKISQSIVDSVASAFGWSAKLSGAPPSVLLDHFKTIYLDVPALTVA